MAEKEKKDRRWWKWIESLCSILNFEVLKLFDFSKFNLIKLNLQFKIWHHEYQIKRFKYGKWTELHFSNRTLRHVYVRLNNPTRNTRNYATHCWSFVNQAVRKHCPIAKLTWSHKVDERLPNYTHYTEVSPDVMHFQVSLATGKNEKQFRFPGL